MVKIHIRNSVNQRFFIRTRHFSNHLRVANVQKKKTLKLLTRVILQKLEILKKYYCQLIEELVLKKQFKYKFNFKLKSTRMELDLKNFKTYLI